MKIKKPSEIEMRETISISRDSFVKWIARCEEIRVCAHNGDITLAREEAEELEKDLREYSGPRQVRSIEEMELD